MTPLAARWRPRWDVAAARAAERAGVALRRLGRGLPGIAGPLLVSAGLWMAWPPLGIIFAGAALWVLDRRV